MQFVINNWYLFLALVVVLVLLVLPNALQLAYGIKSAPPAQCVLLINRESAVVVDVSEQGEFNAGHLPNAVNAPLSLLSKGTGLLDKYKKDRPLVVVARNVNHALKAAIALRKRGYASVTLLGGGLAAWEKENLPLVK